MARPATEQPLEVIAIRLPPSLIAQARRYADLYHTSVSALTREGLDMRLRNPQPTNQYNSNTDMPPAIVALVTRLAAMLNDSAEELRTACQSAPDPEAYDGNTREVSQTYDGNTKTVQEAYDGNTDTTLSAYDGNTQSAREPSDGITSQPEAIPEEPSQQPDIPSFAEDCQVAPAAQGHPEEPPQRHRRHR